LPRSTKFRRRFAVITAMRRAPRRIPKKVSGFPSGVAQILSPAVQLLAKRQPGIFRVFPRMRIRARLRQKPGFRLQPSGETRLFFGCVAPFARWLIPSG
jgi:hypothetical protein